MTETKAAALTVLGGPLAGLRRALPERGTLTIGSSPGSGLQLDLPTVSPYHARNAVAFLAFMVILFWHFYGAHFNPEVWPFDASIFSGNISEERMRHEHPLELERRQAADGKK